MSTTPAARYMYSKTVSRQIFTIAGWLIQNSSPRLDEPRPLRLLGRRGGRTPRLDVLREAQEGHRRPPPELRLDRLAELRQVRLRGRRARGLRAEWVRYSRKVLLNYFASQRLETEPTAFDGRSDYKAFIDAGVPAGSLFSGAEEVKTAEEAAIYGGRGRLRRVLPQGVRRHQQPHQDVARPARRRRGPRHAGFRPDHVGA